MDASVQNNFCLLVFIALY